MVPSEFAHTVGEKAPIMRTQQWGSITQRRVRLKSSFEIDFYSGNRAGLLKENWTYAPPLLWATGSTSSATWSDCSTVGWLW